METQNHPTRARRGSFFALFLILIGLILLLQNFGIINWSVWDVIWRLWPLFLISWGLDRIWPERRLGYLVFLLVIALLLVTVIVGSVRPELVNRMMGLGDSQMQSKHFRYENTNYLGATKRMVVVDNATGQLTVRDTYELYMLDLSNSYWTTAPTVSDSFSNQSANFTVTAHDDNSWFMMGNHHNVTDVTLGNATLPTDLTLKEGAGQTDLFLDRLTLQKLTIETGAGTATVHLSDLSIPTDPSSISVGAGSATLTVPLSIGLQITYKIGLGALSVAGQNLHGNGTYTSPNFGDLSQKQLVLNLEIGAGSLTINN